MFQKISKQRLTPLLLSFLLIFQAIIGVFIPVDISFSPLSLETKETLAAGETAIYRSVGPSATTAIEEGTANSLTISNSIAIFTSALSNNIGVGDALQYDSENNGTIDTIAFIHGRMDSTHYTIKTVSGTSVADMGTADNNWSIFRAYTSLANAETGTENTGINDTVENFDIWSGGKDLTTSMEIWNIVCYHDAIYAEVVIDGWTTSASYYLKLFTPLLSSEVGASQRHNGTVGTGVVIQPTGTAITINDNYIVIDGFEITGGGNITIANTGASYAKIRNCIIHDNTDGFGIYSGTSAVGTLIENTIFYNLTSIGINCRESCFVYNCTINRVMLIEPLAYAGILSFEAATVITVKNTIVMNSGDGLRADFKGYGTGYFSAESSNNISSDNTAPGNNSFLSRVATNNGNPEVGNWVIFEDIASGSEDFHLQNVSENDAMDTGTNLSLSFTTDIDGNTRPDSILWDIGADEWLPEIQFTTAVSSGDEFITSVNLELSLSGASGDNVTVDYAISGGTAISGTDYTFTDGTAIVTAGNTTTTIPITIINDNIDETDETIIITLSNPTNAILGTNTTHTYTIIDNDTAGITITESSSSTNLTEGSITDTYTIVLDTTPANDVTITITPDTQTTVNPSTPTFTSLNWNTPQTITITAVDDSEIESDHTSTITHTSSSSDSNYNALSISSITANITDNDFAGGGMPAGFSNSPSSPSPTTDNPEGEFKAVVQNQNNTTITLKLYAGSDTTGMAISNNPDFKDASIIPYQEEIEWEMPDYRRDGSQPAPTMHTLYIKFYTKYGVASEVIKIETGNEINPINLPNGSLIRMIDDYKVYIIKNNYLRHIIDEIIFSFYGHLNKDDIQETDPSLINNCQESYLIREANDYKVYKIEDNKKQWLNITVEEFEEKYNWEEVFVVNERERDFYKTQ